MMDMGFGSLWGSAGSTWGNLTGMWSDRYDIKSGNAEAERQKEIALAKMGLINSENMQKLITIGLVLVCAVAVVYFLTKKK